MSYHNVYPVVSHHFLRRTARKKAEQLNQRERIRYGDSDRYYAVQKYRRGLYKYRVIERVRDHA